MDERHALPPVSSFYIRINAHLILIYLHLSLKRLTTLKNKQTNGQILSLNNVQFLCSPEDGNISQDICTE